MVAELDFMRLVAGIEEIASKSGERGHVWVRDRTRKWVAGETRLHAMAGKVAFDYINSDCLELRTLGYQAKFLGELAKWRVRTGALPDVVAVSLESELRLMKLEAAELVGRTGLTSQRDEVLRRHPAVVASLDSPIGEGRRTLEDVVPGDSPAPETSALRNALAELILPLVEDLSPREREAVEMSYGLGPEGRVRSLTDLGREWGVTGARAGQIRKSGLVRLRERLEALGFSFEQLVPE